MRSALQTQPRNLQGVSGSGGGWIDTSIEIRSPSRKVVEKMTAYAVKDIPHARNRMLIAPVISREVAKGGWLIKKAEQPPSLGDIEVKWANFVATRLLGREIADPFKEAVAVIAPAFNLTGLAGFLRIAPSNEAWVVGDRGTLALDGLLNLGVSRAFIRDTEPDVAPSNIELEVASPAIRAFTPSRELVMLWVEAVNENLREVGAPEISVEDAVKSPEYGRELSRQIHKIINNFSKRKAYDSGRYRITFGGNLYPSVEGLIVDHLMLPPRSAVQFLNEFRRLVFEQSKPDPVFKGRWGELIIDDANELVIDLQKRRSRRLSGVLRA